MIITEYFKSPGFEEAKISAVERSDVGHVFGFIAILGACLSERQYQENLILLMALI